MRSKLMPLILPLLLASAAGNAQETPGEPPANAGGVAGAEDTGAATDSPSPITITGFASVVSDYRFRGVSLSDRDFAIQGQVRVDSAPGFYVAVWGSSIEQFAGAETELDLFGGWTGNFGGWKPDIGVIGYVYPGGEGVEYYEIYGAVARDIGPVSASVGINYLPDQSNYATDNTYVFATLGVGIPNTPVSLNARLGYEDGAFADEKIDWQIGAAVKYGALSLGVAYVDTDRNFRQADSGVVFSLTGSF